ncbi:MAG TPA: DUF2294 family protein [Clostridia bacterium]|nr:DUF2294 family protein [Clostridia bacterium]
MLLLQRDERLIKARTGLPEARFLSMLSTMLKQVLGESPRALVFRSFNDMILIRMKGVISKQDKAILNNYQKEYRIIQIYKRQVVEAAKQQIMSSLSEYLGLKAKDLFYDLNPERDEAIMAVCFAGNVEERLKLLKK